MAEQQTGTLEAVGIEMTKVFQPFKERVEAGEILLLLAELGIAVPAGLANDSGFQTAVAGASDAIDTMAEKAKAMIDAIKEENYTLAAEALAELIELISGMVDQFKIIANAIEANAPAGLDVEKLARSILDYLAISYMQASIPLFVSFLELFGIITETVENEGSFNPLQPEYLKKSLYLDRIPKLLKNPAGLATELYGWGAPTFTGEDLFKKLEKILNSMGWPAVYDDTGPIPELDLLIAKLQPTTGLSPTGIALVLEENIGGIASQTFSQDKWSLEVGFASELEVSSGVNFQSDGNLSIQSPTIIVEGSAFVKWIAQDNDPQQPLPLLIFGSTAGSRFEAMEISALLGADMVWDPLINTAKAGVVVEAEIKEGKIVIKPGDPDGFLANILPAEGFELDFNLLVGLSSSKGLYFKGSGTLEFDIPLSISIGPIDILNLAIGLSSGDDFGVSFGADIRTELGPFTAIVEGMGVITHLTFPEDRRGNLGPANLAIDFKPPLGIGMSLDAGVVKGGGYLLFDYAKGQYAGAIELEFEGLFSFSAVGVITTKFPDGSEGFSLLLLVNVTFGTPIPLGFNFYLAGVGGLIGLHRTIATLPLQQGVKNGSIDNILFPENIIANITKIISDLDAIFPAKKDQFALGLMARITWNTPAILTIEAGLAVEFANPVKIVILGVIKCALPTPEEAILELNVAFAGIIDFENQILMFDASIYNSRILTITLEGDMALRISWGPQPDFLVSVGGFHPAFTPSAHLMLPPMKRMTVNILSGNPSLVLTSYFAVTTNTLQFGAAIDFSYQFSRFGVYGHFGFDILFQFSPFHFMAGINASVAVKMGGSTLFSIDLEFNLEGPTPWRAHGYGSFRILFVKYKVNFDKTWGEQRATSLPATSVLPLLLEEFGKNSNWKTTSTTSLPELVTLLNPEVGDTVVLVKPYGSFQIDQAVVPLDLTLDKFGNYKPDDISQATIKSVSINGDIQGDDAVANLKNSFAPAAYKEMSDDDKLQAPSYDQQNSGVRIVSTDGITFDYGISRLVEYESILSDFEEVELDNQTFHPDFFKTFVSGGDVGRSPLSKLLKDNKTKADKIVQLGDEQFAVVSTKDLTNIHSENLLFDSKAEADEYLRETIKADPSKKGKIQLTPAYQMVGV